MISLSELMYPKCIETHILYKTYLGLFEHNLSFVKQRYDILKSQNFTNEESNNDNKIRYYLYQHNNTS